MKKQNTPIQLKGKTTKAQVKNFMSLLKDKSVSAEALEKMMPLSTDFIKGLIGGIQKVVDSDREGYASYLQTVDTIIACLKKICEDDKITPEERKQIMDYMVKLAAIIGTVEENHSKRRHGTIRFLSVLGTAFLAVIALVVGKKD